MRVRGTEGIEGIEVFSKEKPFRVVSCDFVDVFLGYVCGFVDGVARKKEGATSQQHLL